MNVRLEVALNDLQCPVTLSPFESPVILQGSGQRVEEDIAIKIMTTSKRCPITRKKVHGYIHDKMFKEIFTLNPSLKELSTSNERISIDLPESLFICALSNKLSDNPVILIPSGIRVDESYVLDADIEFHHDYFTQAQLKSLIQQNQIEFNLTDLAFALRIGSDTQIIEKIVSESTSLDILISQQESSYHRNAVLLAIKFHPKAFPIVIKAVKSLPIERQKEILTHKSDKNETALKLAILNNEYQILDELLGIFTYLKSQEQILDELIEDKFLFETLFQMPNVFLKLLNILALFNSSKANNFFTALLQGNYLNEAILNGDERVANTIFTALEICPSIEHINKIFSSTPTILQNSLIYSPSTFQKLISLLSQVEDELYVKSIIEAAKHNKFNLAHSVLLYHPNALETLFNLVNELSDVSFKVSLLSEETLSHGNLLHLACKKAPQVIDFILDEIRSLPNSEDSLAIFTALTQDRSILSTALSQCPQKIPELIIFAREYLLDKNPYLYANLIKPVLQDYVARKNSSRLIIDILRDSVSLSKELKFILTQPLASRDWDQLIMNANLDEALHVLIPFLIDLRPDKLVKLKNRFGNLTHLNLDFFLTQPFQSERRLAKQNLIKYLTLKHYPETYLALAIIGEAENNQYEKHINLMSLHEMRTSSNCLFFNRNYQIAQSLKQCKPLKHNTRNLNTFMQSFREQIVKL